MRGSAHFILFVTLFVTAGCATAPAPQKAATSPAAMITTRPLIGDHGFDVAGIDRNINACDDFYGFAVGNWRAANPLPGTFSRFGRFEEVSERNRTSLHAILEESARDKNAPAGSATRKIGDYYAACMNEQQVEVLGVSPIQPDLQRIDAITDRAALQKELFRLTRSGVSPGFRLLAENDDKNARMIIAGLYQGGLGMPDRDYYLRDDSRFKETRGQYVEHVARMFELAGAGSAKAQMDAERVMSIETQFAQASMSRIEQRIPENVYHITTIADLRQMTPGVDWQSLLNEAGLQDLQSINVAHPEFFKQFGRVLDEAPLESWKAYLRWKILNTAAPQLSSAFVKEDFNFSGKVLSGQKQMRERWKRCTSAVDANLGDLLGQEYVRRTFTPQAKAKMNELIDNLVAALREDIPTLTWMGPETKREALVKLDAFTRRIGYPDKWRDYASLTVGDDSYGANAAAARAFTFQRDVSRIGKPDDPNEWGFFTPPTVNASYNPNRNDITFPAGILQPPFYDPNADDAYNYGGIGMVIGHEMSHGFDDQGAKYDATGNLRDWWTAADLKNFQSRAECIANQYSEFVVEPGLNIQGKLVTGEAIGDLGGVMIAYRAYQKSLQGKPRQDVDGFTPEQRFFLGFAQVWGENMAMEEQRRRALTDPHAQGPFRVNATVSNMPEFQRAFKCADSSRMVRETAKRCSIW